MRIVNVNRKLQAELAEMASLLKGYCRAPDCYNKPKLGEVFCNSCRKTQLRRQPHDKTHEKHGTIYVYFIGCGDDVVKIGRTYDVNHRLQNLQSSNPQELTLLCSFLAYNGTESSLHERFAEYNIRGEWFRLSPEILEYIEKMNA